MYGTIKAHKPEKDYPMRIVVSTIGTPTHGISEYLVKVIKPVLNKTEKMLKNSLTFVRGKNMGNLTTRNTSVLYDVVNLYPSFPLREATNVIVEMISKELIHKSKLKINEIKLLIELCLSYNVTFYGTVKSMFLKLQDQYDYRNEKEAINIALQIKPPIDFKSFKRYVDG